VSDWATRVREALREDRLLLYIQPIVRLSDSVVQHYEVLLRLRDEAGQVVPPGAFLPSAERFGLMPAIDRQVVRQALALLREQPDLRLFVNLSGASLADELLLDEIEARVVAASLAPERLAFEITETVAMDSPTRARHWMRRLRQAGCHFALDDFGIGFSSFAYLQQLPADYVKIDGSFVRDLDSNATNRALVQAITAVAHALGKETIAEWVENESTATILRDLGVEHGQGYLWGRPEPAPAAR
jgi:EAL domain-containing protein (putative c-di-GMP-specific phosphodiesterase class I)